MKILCRIAAYLSLTVFTVLITSFLLGGGNVTHWGHGFSELFERFGGWRSFATIIACVVFFGAALAFMLYGLALKDHPKITLRLLAKVVVGFFGIVFAASLGFAFFNLPDTGVWVLLGATVMVVAVTELIWWLARRVP